MPRACTHTHESSGRIRARYTYTRTKVGGEGGGGGRPAWLYMWAKNDTLAKVTSCEVSPVCRRLHWLAVSQLLRCGNDVAGALYGWLAGWLVGVKVTARTIVVFALLYASRAPSDPVLWLCSRGSITECEREREGERERDGFRERHVRWNRSGYIGSPVMRIRLDVSSKVEFFSVDL